MYISLPMFKVIPGIFSIIRSSLQTSYNPDHEIDSYFYEDNSRKCLIFGPMQKKEKVSLSVIEVGKCVLI
jgi:hypothetical protein